MFRYEELHIQEQQIVVNKESQSAKRSWRLRFLPRAMKESAVTATIKIHPSLSTVVELHDIEAMESSSLEGAERPALPYHTPEIIPQQDPETGEIDYLIHCQLDKRSDIALELDLLKAFELRDEAHRFSQSLSLDIEEASGQRSSHEIKLSIDRLLWASELEPFKNILGVDFGTSTTTMAYCGFSESDKVEIIDFSFDPLVQSSQAHTLMPSAILWLNFLEQKYHIGLNALNLNLRGAPLDALVKELKRYIVNGGEDQSFHFRDYDTGATHKDNPLNQVEYYLKELVLDAEKRFVTPTRLRGLDDLIVTSPVNWSEAQKRALLERAAKAFDISPDRIHCDLDEASAAALFHVWKEINDSNVNVFAIRHGLSHRFLIFDIGGGTTDIALVRVLLTKEGDTISKITITVEGIAGYDRGGNDLTMALFPLLKRKVAAKIAEQVSAVLGSEDSRNRYFEKLAKRFVPEDQSSWQSNLINNINTLKMSQSPLPSSMMEVLVDQLLPTCYRLEEKGYSPECRLLATALFRNLFVLAESMKHGFGQQSEVEQVTLRDASSDKIKKSLNVIGEIYDIDTEPFYDLSLTKTEFEACTESVLQNAILRARLLCEAARREQDRKLAEDSENAESERARVSRIILAGQSSKLPLVRQVFKEVFDGKRDLFDPNHDDNFVFNHDEAKSCVVRGACVYRKYKPVSGEPNRGMWSIEPYSARNPYYVFFVHHNTGPVLLFDRGASLPARCKLDNHKDLLDQLKILTSITHPKYHNEEVEATRETPGYFDIRQMKPFEVELEVTEEVVVESRPEPKGEAEKTGKEGLFKKTGRMVSGWFKRDKGGAESEEKGSEPESSSKTVTRTTMEDGELFIEMDADRSLSLLLCNSKGQVARRQVIHCYPQEVIQGEGRI